MKPATLCRSADFRRVSGEGIRSRRDGVGVAALRRTDSEPARVGYTVRRTAGRAVTRNRVKRRLRAAAGSIDISPGFDVVISGTAEVASIDFQVLVDHVTEALGRTGAVK